MKRKVTIIIIGLLLGTLIVVQARSFKNVSAVFNRDSSINIFREVQILKTTDKSLKSEITRLEEVLETNKDRTSVLKAIEAEIAKNRLLSGDKKIYGQGIKIIVDGEISISWTIDLVNELYGSGAEAISINGIRLTNQTTGFDKLPNGQMMVNSVILNKPYTLNAIGNSDVLFKALNQPAGFISKLKEFQPQSSLTIEKQKSVEIEKL
ncbi:MAG: hypothetical protein US89_C0001G0014 [Candidatus Peregrinibacteria bacterium GW2011_GWF2_38_29]|nr:MAG: hypothetical protein US89_C0001G0014 [Candidatus Peregrinibacteria bacterium GW2011_GWF2_38_29]HBB03049.1 hypothetical protein [Candidatus Peregrinibacteria bacterium]